MKKAITVYTLVVAFIGFGMGLSDNLFSNYFRDAFEVDAFWRGFLEVPREMPGVLAVFILSALAFWGDKKLAVFSIGLKFIGIMLLALANPGFNMMMIYLFITTMGMHIFFPLYDSIGMSLANNGDFGKMLGRFNAWRIAFSLLAAALSFWGFRSGFFSFTTPIIVNFLIAGAAFAVVFFLLIYLMKITPNPHPAKSHFVLKKEYINFYILAALFGGRKQIIFVFGPWVLIELFDFGADYISLLIIVSAIASIIALPFFGRLIDKYGAPRIMVIEVFLFFIIYFGYGFISGGIHGGLLVRSGFVIALVVLVHVLDRVVLNFGMARSIYLRTIALSSEDVTPTIATGMALDHIFSIGSALLCGWLWWEFGPQYVFIFSGILALAQLVVARRIDVPKKV